MNWTSLKRTTAPGGAVVTTAEAKAHLRVTHSADDTLIAELVSAATGKIEADCNRALAEQTWTMTLAGFPCGDTIRLPIAQVLSLVVTYFDADDASQTFASSNYHVVSDEFGGELFLHRDAIWPTTVDRPDAVSIAMVCGYAKDGSDYGANVPSALKTAINIRTEIDYRPCTPEDVEAKERAIATLISGFVVRQK